ncbi:MAG: universal stress protein [Bacteroidetes bacterium]|nr:universal stress protein [Bacteroidota bacterium]MBX7127839.1 universal stress protein [Flavobacteriales bacterium]MCC6653602.1 universal stress protein [Flavobacteriales bacterium]HMU13047.1 universal stress protein [Flavobacteriales bacterium]HMW96836.1 universal stress protein [Flavobacteriales bacterium]
MSTPKKILVPTDFTRVAECALNHASVMAGRMDANIHLLHIVADKDEVEEARTKLDMAIARAQKAGVDRPLVPEVRVGSLYDLIGTAAAEIGAGLIIMGTHGMRGMQFITGSRALRVITNSAVPFIVVQERNIRPTGYQKIVVPLDLQKESRQKLTLVADMAKYFKCKVYLVTPNEKDEFLHNQVVNHLRFANTYLNERGIEHEEHILEEGSDDIVQGTIRYAVQVDADLITIVNTLQNSIFGVLGVPNEQEVITNAPQIPVMCMNPNTVGYTNAPVFNV